MPIECLAEMIVGIDANPPKTDEEFEEAIAYWRMREREMPRKIGNSLEHALALLSRTEIESILSTRKIRQECVPCTRSFKSKPNHGGARVKGEGKSVERFKVTFISEEEQAGAG